MGIPPTGVLIKSRPLICMNREWGVRIIAASGHAEESQQNELSDLGVQTILKKPYNNYQLLKSVHDTIHAPAKW